MTTYTLREETLAIFNKIQELSRFTETSVLRTFGSPNFLLPTSAHSPMRPTNKIIIPYRGFVEMEGIHLAHVRHS